MTGPHARGPERRPVFNLGVRLHPIELAGWHSLKLVPMGEVGQTASIWERGEAWVRVWLAESPNEQAARGMLEVNLAHAMRPDIPPGEEQGVFVGDVSRAVADDAGIIGAVWFVRGNCCVAVNRANDAPADTFEVAAAIDLSLTVPPRGQARRTEVSAAEPGVVVQNLAELAGRRLHVSAPTGSFVAESGAVRYFPAVGGPGVDSTRRIPITVTIGDQV